jgi:hypothetical protein
MDKVHVLKETPNLEKFFNVRHPKLMRDFDLIDPKVFMDSLPDIAIVLLRQFKDQGRQITWEKSAKPRIGPKLRLFSISNINKSGGRKKPPVLLIAWITKTDPRFLFIGPLKP